MSGYSYCVTDDQIQRWQALSASEKLKVIEAFMQFNDQVASPEIKERQRRFRAGKHETCSTNGRCG